MTRPDNFSLQLPSYSHQTSSFFHNYQPVITQYIHHLLAETLSQSDYSRQLINIITLEPETNAVNRSLELLPLLTYWASGGCSKAIIPVVAAWQLIYRSAKLFDDVEDGEARDRSGELINLATGLLFMAQQALIELSKQEADCKSIEDISYALNQAVLRACAGQHADLRTNRTEMGQTDPETWLAIAGAKSGELLAWAAWAGARMAGAGEQTQACYRRYGYHLGILLQIADDFNGIWQPDDESDLAKGQLNLSVCYAILVTNEEEQTRLTAQLERVRQRDKRAEQQVQQWLIDIGAQAYSLVAGRLHYQQALAALSDSARPPVTNEQLKNLLDQILPAIGD